ncbi:MAG: hypothetical protein MZW92_55320 [Comamonadaceae bacterium]|nr:hypothetical protein [Comamonadaceae bacterium]
MTAPVPEAGHGEPAVARRPAGALDAALAHLAAHPGRHGLYPALRLPQRWLADGGDELAPALRVRNSDSLAFAGVEIESLTIVAGDAGLPARVELVPAFGSAARRARRAAGALCRTPGRAG